jgi:hypothetical protein
MVDYFFGPQKKMNKYLWIVPSSCNQGEILSEAPIKRLGLDALAHVLYFLDLFDLSTLRIVGDVELWAKIQLATKQIRTRENNMPNSILLPVVAFNPFPLISGFRNLQSVSLYRIDIGPTYKTTLELTKFPTNLKHLSYEETHPRKPLYIFDVDFLTLYPELETLRLASRLVPKSGINSNSEMRWIHNLRSPYLRTLSLLRILSSETILLTHLVSNTTQSDSPGNVSSNKISKTPITYPIPHLERLEIPTFSFPPALDKLPPSLTIFNSLERKMLKPFFKPTETEATAQRQGILGLTIESIDKFSHQSPAEVDIVFPSSLQSLSIHAPRISRSLGFDLSMLPFLKHFKYIGNVVFKTPIPPNLESLSLTSVSHDTIIQFLKDSTHLRSLKLREMQSGLDEFLDRLPSGLETLWLPKYSMSASKIIYLPRKLTSLELYIPAPSFLPPNFPPGLKHLCVSYGWVPDITVLPKGLENLVIKHSNGHWPIEVASSFSTKLRYISIKRLTLQFLARKTELTGEELIVKALQYLPTGCLFHGTLSLTADEESEIRANSHGLTVSAKEAD